MRVNVARKINIVNELFVCFVFVFMRRRRISHEFSLGK